MINEALKSMKGEPLVKSEHRCPNCKCVFGEKSDITVQDSLLAALMNAVCKPGDKPSRFKLMQKIANACEWKFEQAEMDLLKKCIAEDSPPIIFGRLMEILDAD